MSAGATDIDPSAPDTVADEFPDGPPFASKASKQAKRPGRGKAKAKAKGEPRSGAEAEADANARGLADVAALGTRESEEGLDAFDSFAITGKIHKKRVKHAERFKDIVLPDVFVGIVTDLGQKDLIIDASLQVLRGHRYGLIGRNGCGKTTLLRRVALRQLPGLPDLRYGYVAQDLVGSEQSVLEAACSGDLEFQELRLERASLEETLASEDSCPELADELASVTQRLSEVEGFFGSGGLERHALGILLGLQFTEEMLAMPTRALSGGWRMRLALAQALLSRADCLLLDEPTNHLDLAGVLWLKRFLETSLSPDCMLVLISHDRAFLDGIVTDIIEIKGMTIEQGPGNLTGWLHRHAQEREAALAVLEANERERQRTKDMAKSLRDSASRKRGEADTNKLRVAKQREQHLHGRITSSGEETTYGRLELVTFQGKTVDPKHLAATKLLAEEKIKIRLPEPELLSGVLLHLERASFTIEETGRTILSNVKLSLEPQSRVAVVGPNGAGKTTLLRWLEGEQWPEIGSQRHPKLKVAHVSQHHLEGMENHLAETGVSYVRSVLPDLPLGADPSATLSNVAKDEYLRGYLGHFGLGGIAAQKVGSFSGGEKARLAFASQVWHRPHLLLLDEPTNHLDVETLDALAEALRAFPGAAVIVSHNQGFLEVVCNELWTVDAGKLTCSRRGEAMFAAAFAAYCKAVLESIELFPRMRNGPVSSQKDGPAVSNFKPKGRNGKRNHDVDPSAKVLERIEAILHEPLGEDPGPISKRILACGIETQEHVEVLARGLVGRAAAQADFQLYAELCGKLRTGFAESKESGVPEVDFKRSLLSECQGAIEIMLKPDSAGGKTLLLGSVRFLAALIVEKIVASSIVVAVSEALLAEPTSAKALESVAAFLTTAGGAVDKPSWKHLAAFNEIFVRLQRHVADVESDVPTRVRRQLSSVIALRAQGWILPVGQR